MHVSAVWLTNVTGKLHMRVTMQKAIATLQSKEFDTVVFCGVSGGLFGPTLAYTMDKEVTVVRKPDAHTHSVYKLEGYVGPGRYLIVDDVMDSGKTLAHIMKMMKRQSRATLAGIYLYGEGRGCIDSPEGFIGPRSAIMDRIKVHLEGES